MDYSLPRVAPQCLSPFTPSRRPFPFNDHETSVRHHRCCPVRLSVAVGLKLVRRDDDVSLFCAVSSRLVRHFASCVCVCGRLRCCFARRVLYLRHLRRLRASQSSCALHPWHHHPAIALPYSYNLRCRPYYTDSSCAGGSCCGRPLPDIRSDGSSRNPCAAF
jgi:hypothetical protein